MVDLDDFDTFHCLMNGGICGLPNWAAEQIDVVGNLAERNYGPDAVAAALTTLKTVAPSLRVKVHCGGDYEDPDCVATVTLADTASVGPPEVTYVGAISHRQLLENTQAHINMARRRHE